MSYECHIVLDFEFNPVKKQYRYLLRDEIIEIGAIKLNPQYEEIGRFTCLVRPELNDMVDPVITKLTGIRTADVMNAVDFKTALGLLSDWIGPVRARVYSWSDNDLRQLCRECEAKELCFPENMYRWMDLQKVFQRIIHYPSRCCMALKYAAGLLGIPFDGSRAHRAVYDTEVTAELLRTVKSEGFIYGQREAHRVFISESSGSTYSIGSVWGDRLSSFMAQLQTA